MDALITAAARALAAGDPLGALDRVALRDDPPALALRGIAMAQLGDFARARTLLRSAARAFSPRQTLARARCVVAEAEIAFAARDLGQPDKPLEAARAVLEQAMARNRLTRSELESEMRLAGIAHVADVAWGVLETNGKISFIARNDENRSRSF